MTGWGSLSGKLCVDGAAGDRFAAFVDRVLGKEIVVLAGSGLTHDAPKADALAKRLYAAMFPSNGGRPPQGMPPLPASSTELAAALPRIASLYEWMIGRTELITELGLLDFKAAQPGLAHRFMALLARESLLDCVLTTNYDCCLETAHFATLSKKKARRQGSPESSVATCDSHRQKGTSEFRVVKVNGCSHFHSVSKDEDQSTRIRVTYCDILDLTTEPEREDLAEEIKYRLGSKDLVITGFGSDEQQIMGLVTSRAYRRARGGRTPDKTWICCFEDEVPFHLLALLQTQRPPPPSNAGEIPRCSTLFVGSDAADLWGSGTDDDRRLDAGRFWQAVWFFVMHRRTREAECDMFATKGSGPKAEVWREIHGLAWKEAKCPVELPQWLKAEPNVRRPGPGVANVIDESCGAGDAESGFYYVPSSESIDLWVMLTIVAAAWDRLEHDGDKSPPPDWTIRWNPAIPSYEVEAPAACSSQTASDRAARRSRVVLTMGRSDSRTTKEAHRAPTGTRDSDSAISLQCHRISLRDILDEWLTDNNAAERILEAVADQLWSLRALADSRERQAKQRESRMERIEVPDEPRP